MVSGGTTRARNRSIHDSDSGERCRRRSIVRRAFNPEWNVRARRMAMAVLVEGIPAIVLGITVLVYLTDRPETAAWLTSAEKDWLMSTLAVERTSREGVLPGGIFGALTNPTIWHLGIIFLCAAIGFYGYSFWAPLVVKSLTETSDLGVGVILCAISAVTIIL